MTVEPAPGEPGLIRFSVQDTGIGIPEDKLGSIFEQFSQADQSTTRQFGGTGLGLSIARRLVAAMGGRIWVTSTPGEGSCFAFVLPEAALADGQWPTVAAAGPQRAVLSVAWPATRAVAETILTEAGFQVDSVPSEQLADAARGAALVIVSAEAAVSSRVEGTARSSSPSRRRISARCCPEGAPPRPSPGRCSERIWPR